MKTKKEKKNVMRVTGWFNAAFCWSFRCGCVWRSFQIHFAGSQRFTSGLVGLSSLSLFFFVIFFNKRTQIGRRRWAAHARRSLGETTRRANFQKVNNKTLIEGTERNNNNNNNKLNKKKFSWEENSDFPFEINGAIGSEEERRRRSNPNDFFFFFFNKTVVHFLFV